MTKPETSEKPDDKSKKTRVIKPTAKKNNVTRIANSEYLHEDASAGPSQNKTREKLNTENKNAVSDFRSYLKIYLETVGDPTTISSLGNFTNKHGDLTSINNFLEQIKKFLSNNSNNSN